MKAHRRFLVATIMSMFMVLTCHAITINPALPITTDLLIEMSYNRLNDDELIESFYKDHIPEEYCDAFLYYTKDCPELRMNFYSLMVHESCNFKYFKNTNKNGTIDLGPSQLNSSNLNNKRFVKAFTPEDESKITSTYCYYMVLTIGYYRDLYKRFGDKYAFYAYNGGDKAAIMIKNGETHNRSLVKNVTAYDKAVRKIIKSKTKELEDYIQDERVKHVMSIYEEFETLNNGIKLNSVCTNIIKTRFDKIGFNNTAYFFKRKNLLNLKSEELVIEYYSLIGVFYNQLC